MRKSFPDKARVMVFQVCGQNANFWSAFCLHYLNMFWHFVGIMKIAFQITFYKNVKSICKTRGDKGKLSQFLQTLCNAEELRKQADTMHTRM